MEILIKIKWVITCGVGAWQCCQFESENVLMKQKLASCFQLHMIKIEQRRKTARSGEFVCDIFRTQQFQIMYTKHSLNVHWPKKNENICIDIKCDCLLQNVFENHCWDCVHEYVIILHEKFICLRKSKKSETKYRKDASIQSHSAHVSILQMNKWIKSANVSIINIPIEFNNTNALLMPVHFMQISIFIHLIFFTFFPPTISFVAVLFNSMVFAVVADNSMHSNLYIIWNVKTAHWPAAIANVYNFRRSTNLCFCVLAATWLFNIYIGKLLEHKMYLVLCIHTRWRYTIVCGFSSLLFHKIAHAFECA